MNRKKFLEKLLALLLTFNFSKTILVEIDKELHESGNEPKFLAVFEERLKFLRDNIAAVSEHKEFELLGKGIYSLHIAGHGFNMRILFCIYHSQAVLLYAFHEKAGHAKTDYSGKVNIALERFSAMKEDINE